MEEIRKQIAKNLKALREQYRLSQSELARKTGIRQTKLSRCEAGINLPTILECIILADFYDISLDDLIGRN